MRGGRLWCWFLFICFPILRPSSHLKEHALLLAATTGFVARAALAINLSDEIEKDLLHVHFGLCRGFQEGAVELFGQTVALLC